MSSVRKPSQGWRLKATHDRYQKQQKNRPKDCPCVLCSAKSVQEFDHWRIITNKFPYDRIAKTHHLLITKRHTDGVTLTAAEQTELKRLKTTVLDTSYALIAEAVPKKKTVPGHYHLHLLVPRW